MDKKQNNNDLEKPIDIIQMYKNELFAANRKILELENSHQKIMTTDVEEKCLEISGHTLLYKIQMDINLGSLIEVLTVINKNNSHIEFRKFNEEPEYIYLYFGNR